MEKIYSFLIKSAVAVLVITGITTLALPLTKAVVFIAAVEQWGNFIRILTFISTSYIIGWVCYFLYKKIIDNNV